MCSLGDDDFENEAEKAMPKENDKKLSEVCNKCRQEKSCVVLRSKDTYCKDCFLTATVHKFKASLGKSRLIQLNDKVLVLYKVGHPSTSLLHFLRSGLDLLTPKKLRFIPTILFIEDQFQLTIEERIHLLKQVKEKVTSFAFNVYFVSFAEYISNPHKISELVVTDYEALKDSCCKNLDSVIDVKTTLTNKNDLKKLLRRNLLIEVAKHLECKFVFTPEISVDLASELLSNVSLGRGSHISIDIGFCDDRHSEVKILKPLRQFDIKELAFFNKLNNLEPLSVREVEVNPYSSVQNLMTKFVTDLQINYPATVTTILKTGDKLGTNQNFKNYCKICKGHIPKIDDQLSSQHSTNFSHLVSNEQLDYSVSRQERFQKLSEKFDKIFVKNDSICYSCSNVSNHLKLGQ